MEFVASFSVEAVDYTNIIRILATVGLQHLKIHTFRVIIGLKEWLKIKLNKPLF